MARYISVEIFRSDLGDCTRNGVSSPANSKGKMFVVPCESGNWDDNDITRNPDNFVILNVVRENIGGRENVFLRPDCLARGVWSMFGGNFAWTSDSRFRQSVSEAPLRIHDRVE